MRNITYEVAPKSNFHPPYCHFSHRLRKPRAIRGGAWNTVSRAIRTANRHWAYPYRDDIVGFRCAMDEK
ncbi:MAG: hypothetical protein HND47_11240 [Chloroflexi bacterium]|nr:hypothetical protein [Chloroflexota bacterium]